MFTTSTVLRRIIVLKILLCLQMQTINASTTNTTDSIHQKQSRKDATQRGVKTTSLVFTNVTITGYCSCTKCCGPQAKGICANNKPPIQGTTIAGSRKYSLGSNVIYNNRTYILQDRLAKRYDSRFDIFFAKHSDAKQFGIKTNQTVVLVFNTK